MLQRSYIPGLDGLRALACMAVFAVHWQQITHADGHLGPIDLETLLENGNTGVALFFLLSGLLLGLPWWHQPARPFSPKRYFLSRAARIGPAYYLCLTTLVIAASHWHTPSDLADSTLHYTFTHNLAEFSIYSLNDPFWTIAVQVQFYLLFPLLLLVTAPLRKWTALGAVALLALAFGAYIAHRRVMMVYDPRPSDYVLSHSLLAHLPLFLAGWAAGPLLPRSDTRKRPGRLSFDALFLLAAAAIIAILGVPDLDDTFTIPFGRYNLPYVPALLLIMILTAPRARVIRAILEWDPIRLLGVISYGVYLYHLPCLRLVSNVLQRGLMSVKQHEWLFAAAGLTLSVVVATLSWLIIEKPILRAAKGQARPEAAPDASA